MKRTWPRGEDFVESFEAKPCYDNALQKSGKHTFWTNEGSARCLEVRGFAANLPKRLGSENIFPRPIASSAAEEA